MTAHHHDDSLETFFMRSLRKKTYEGLFSIPFRRIHESLQIIRPLINFKKIKLKEICKFYNIDWISDSSNFNFFYERPRIRERLSNFSGKKLNFLAKELKKNKIDNENVEKKITDFFISNLRHNQNGSFEIGKKKLLKIKQNIQIEILRRILRTCSSKIYLPCFKSTKLILEKLKKYKISKFTLHSCLIVLKNDKILIYRESKATQKKMNKGLVVDIKNSNFWDNRFKIYSDKYELHCELITERNWVELKNNFYNGNNIPFDIIKTLPLIRFNKKKVICIICARGGSKGLKNKNILKVNGLPLIAYPIIQAKKSKTIGTVLVTTDSNKIANIAKKYGAIVPFLRPKNLAKDNSTTEETLQHALINYEKILKYKFDIAVYLSASDFFRKKGWIDQSVKILLKNKNLESVFSGHATHKNFWEFKNNKWQR